MAKKLFIRIAILAIACALPLDKIGEKVHAAAVPKTKKQLLQAKTTDINCNDHAPWGITITENFDFNGAFSIRFKFIAATADQYGALVNFRNNQAFLGFFVRNTYSYGGFHFGVQIIDADGDWHATHSHGHELFNISDPINPGQEYEVEFTYAGTTDGAIELRLLDDTEIIFTLSAVSNAGLGTFTSETQCFGLGGGAQLFNGEIKDLEISGGACTGSYEQRQGGNRYCTYGGSAVGIACTDDACCQTHKAGNCEDVWAQ
jgi:hypothetical protein